MPSFACYHITPHFTYASPLAMIRILAKKTHQYASYLRHNGKYFKFPLTVPYCNSFSRTNHESLG